MRLLLGEDKKECREDAMQADAVDPQAMHDEMQCLRIRLQEEDQKNGRGRIFCK